MVHTCLRGWISGEILVSVEVVVGRVERQRNVHLKQGLSCGVGLLHKPDVDSSDSVLRFGEGRLKLRIRFEVWPGSRRRVTRSDLAGSFTRHPKGEARAVLLRAGSAMNLKALTNGPRAPDVQVTSSFGQ